MLNRRTFLQASATAVALNGAAESPAGANKPGIRCGIIGVDHPHAIDFIEVVLASPDYELVGVAEPDTEIWKRQSKEGPLQNLQPVPLDTLLSDPSIQVIAVESEVARSLGFARKVVESRKHLYLDKPAGVSYPEWEEIVDIARRDELLIQLGYMFRYNPGFDLVRKAVREGWLGEIYSLSASMSTDWGPDKRALNVDFPGGAFFNLGSHLVDLAVGILGEPDKIHSVLRHDGPFDDNVIDNAWVVMEYGKAIVSLEVNAMEPDAFRARRFKVCGTNGLIELQPLEPPKGEIVLKSPAGDFAKGRHPLDFPDTDRHVRDILDLASCIRGERKPTWSLHHELAVQRTLLKACEVEV